MSERIVILGAGLSGNLAAILLARQGFGIRVFDRGPPPGTARSRAGRSINLALAARGIRALERAGVFADIEPLLLPMSGRIVHELDGTQRFLAYGQRSDERIWSVSRADLNRRLYEIGRDRWRIDYRFGQVCTHIDPDSLRATLEAPEGGSELAAKLLLAADGAGSTIRRGLAAAGALRAREVLLDHGYKELLVPPRTGGGFALAPDGLHIWPRGGYMLIALPNADGSFTATLFLPHQGRPGFDTVTADTVGAFFAEHFPDAGALIPDLESQFRARPVGTLGTVHCAPWHQAASDGSGRHVLLLGDAAHAIVPFHGQGMNAAFEDCVELDRLIAEHGPDWALVTRRFEAARRDNTDAIAAMALENYEEMRDTVRDPRFERRAALAFELEKRCAGRFIPRYSMVMFHPEIGYAEAKRRGEIQRAILDAALGAADDETALALAARLVEERL